MTLGFLWNFHYVVQGYHDIPISKDFLSSPSAAWKVFTYKVKIRWSHLLFPPEVFKIKNSRRISLTYAFYDKNYWNVRWDKDLWIYGQNTQIAKYIVGGDTKTIRALLIHNIFLIFFYEISFICI